MGSGRSANGLRHFGIWSGTSLILLSGCGTPTPPQDVQAPEPAALALPVPSGVSLNAAMVALIDHSAHEIWNLGMDKYVPETEAQWDDVEYHAIQLAAAGPLLSVGGTGPMDATWVKSPDWVKHARAMIDAGVRAFEASQKRDREALVAIGDDLTRACENCHKQFKPDLPTEGVVHLHDHDVPDPPSGPHVERK